MEQKNRKLKKVLVVGECLLEMEVPYPETGEETQMPRPKMWYGSAVSMTLALRRLGVETAVLATVGDDSFGNRMVQDMAEAGVDTKPLMIERALSTSCIFHFVDIAGQSIDQQWPDSRGAHTILERNSINWKAVEDADWVHVDGRLLQQDEPVRRSVVEILQRAAVAGTATSLDLGFEVAPNEMLDTRLRAAVLEAADYCSYLFGKGPQQYYYLFPDADWQVSAQFLIQPERTVIVRRGQEGSMAMTYNGLVDRPGFGQPAVEERGADTAYNATFIAARLASLPLAEVVLWANAAWHYAASRREIAVLPTQNELRPLVEQYRQDEQQAAQQEQ